MDRDGFLAQSAAIPTLRVYSWIRPTVSMGHFSDPKLAAMLAAGRPLVRRPTGGGLVEHADFNDLHNHTYSLVIPRCHPAARWRSGHLYHLVHQAMIAVLDPHIKSLYLASSIDCRCSSQCFTSPTPGDLMLAGRKVAGAAQRRSRHALLQQGAIQSIPLPAGFWEEFSTRLGGDLNPLPEGHD